MRYKRAYVMMIKLSLSCFILLGWPFVVSIETGKTYHPGKANPVQSGASLRVTPNPVSFGETERWTIKITNPGHTSLHRVQVDVCMPFGWLWQGADVPSYPSVLRGGRCHTHMIGTLPGFYETVFYVRLSMERDAGYGLVSTVPSTGDFFLSAEYTDENGKTQRVLIHEVSVISDVNENRMFHPGTEVAGRVFVDVNDSGTYEEGEPFVSFARVMADGQTIAITNRSGRFKAPLPPNTRFLWVDTPIGTGPPVAVDPHVMLPLSPIDVDLSVKRHADGARAVTNRLFFEGGIHHGGGRDRLAARLDWGRESGRGQAEAEALLLFDPSLSDKHGAFRLYGKRIVGKFDFEGEAYAGPLRTMRSSRFRPSKQVVKSVFGSVGAAWHVPGIFVYNREGTGDRERATDRRGTVTARGEVAAFEGDIWSCSLWAAENEWILSNDLIGGGVSVTADVAVGRHEEVTAKGVRTERIDETGLMIAKSGGNSPWIFEMSRGTGRRLAPSCGLSPKEGTRWRLVSTSPVLLDEQSFIDAVQMSGAVWPAANQRPLGDEDTDAFEDAGSDNDGATSGARAYELLMRYRPFAGDRLTIGTALQWGHTLLGEKWILPALRFHMHLLETHDLLVEYGPESLYESKGSVTFESSDRISAAWKIGKGEWRPWLRYTLTGKGSARAGEGEFGIQGGGYVGKVGSQLRTSVSTRISRAIRKRSFLDRFTISTTTGHVKGRVEWSGRTPFTTSYYDRVTLKGELTYVRPETVGDIKIVMDTVSTEDEVALDMGARVAGVWHYGHFLVGKGIKIAGPTDDADVYDSSMVAITFEKGRWKAGLEFQHHRAITPATRSTSYLFTEIKRAVGHHASLVATRTHSTNRLRHTVGLEWMPGMSSSERPFEINQIWALRLEAEWTRNTPPAFILGMSLPTQW